MRLFSLESKLDLLLNSFCFQDVSNNLEGPKTGFDEASIVKEGVPAFVLEMQCKAVRTLQSFWKGLNAKSCRSGTGAASKASPQAAAAAAQQQQQQQQQKQTCGLATYKTLHVIGHVQNIFQNNSCRSRHLVSHPGLACTRQNAP